MSNPPLRVEIDEKICQGTGYSARLASHIFAVRGDKGVVIDAHSPADQEALLEEAATLCPTGAITY